ncbi:MAG: hypothetical protein JNL01_12970 [Bdellovibrionales bacterium]|nr:hypothetical protein [Bdellovibrionales bacterium]
MGTLSGCLSPDFTYLPSKKARIATAQKSSIEAASIVAFETTVHPVLRSYCAGCHASTQSPFFASPDVGTAHTELIQAAKVNFQDIPSSRLIQRLSLDLHNCWKDCAVAAAEMRSAIEEWSRLRGAETGMTGQTTAKVRIPAGLGTTALTLNFPIETLLNPALRGAVIDLSVVKFDNYSYRFFNPRIRSTTATAVYVKGIKLVMNGIVPTGSTTYNAIDQVVTTSAGTTGTTLSTSSMILEMARGPGNDEIALNFEALTYGSGAALAAQRFSTARQSLQQNCNGCHTNDASGLRPNFGSLQTEADFRAAVWKNSPLIVPGNSAASVLYKVVAGTQTPAMPPNASTANRTPIATTLRNWIDGMQ